MFTLWHAAKIKAERGASFWHLQNPPYFILEYISVATGGGWGVSGADRMECSGGCSVSSKAATEAVRVIYYLYFIIGGC